MEKAVILHDLQMIGKSISLVRSPRAGLKSHYGFLSGSLGFLQYVVIMTQLHRVERARLDRAVIYEFL